MPRRLKHRQRDSNSCQLVGWWMRGRSHERGREVAAAFSVLRSCIGDVPWLGRVVHAVVRSSQRNPACHQPRHIAAAAGRCHPRQRTRRHRIGHPLGIVPPLSDPGCARRYDTNVFASSAGQQTGSAYEAIRPSLDVRSDWNNHMLNFGGYGAFGFFNNATPQNYQNFGVNTDGRLDIYRDWYLTANAAFTGTTELLGTPDVAQTLSPSVVYAVPINLGMFQ